MRFYFAALLLVALGFTLAQSTFVEDLLFSDANAVRVWLESSVDVNAIPEGEVLLPLEIAATYNTDAAVTELLLAAGAKVNALSEYGTTALQGAVAWNPNPEITRLLLEAGAELHVNGNSVLVEAARQNSPEVVQLLVSAGANVNEFVGGNSPLFAALQQNCSDVVEILLELEADVNVVSPSGQTALHSAVRRTSEVARYARPNQLKGEYPTPCQDNVSLEAIILTLIRAGANLDVSDDSGRTPLMIAAGFRRLEAIKVLLDAGAEVNTQTQRGSSALSTAIASKVYPSALDLEVIRYLLAHGADPATDAVAEALLHVAQFPPYDLAIVETLAKAGANINYWPSTFSPYPGYTFPLIISMVKRREANVLRVLIQQGADLEIRDDSGRTALLWAGLSYDKCLAEYQPYSFDIVHLLVESGANVNVRALPLDGWKDYCESSESTYDTPLLQAVKRGGVEATKLIVRAGADLQAKDSHGWTALDFAVQTEQEEIIKVLLEASQQ